MISFDPRRNRVDWGERSVDRLWLKREMWPWGLSWRVATITLCVCWGSIRFMFQTVRLEIARAKWMRCVQGFHKSQSIRDNLWFCCDGISRWPLDFGLRGHLDCEMSLWENPEPISILWSRLHQDKSGPLKHGAKMDITAGLAKAIQCLHSNGMTFRTNQLQGSLYHGPSEIWCTEI